MHKTLGFVPTMGSLHEGHLSLIKKSISDKHFTIASIFVNPIQFNSKSDFEKYPVQTEKDIQMLSKAGCDAVFIPTPEEIYGSDIHLSSSDLFERELHGFDISSLEGVMEGEFRPGHLKGVAVVVKKLFNLVDPDFAYFGKKDYQQLLLIMQLTVFLKKNTTIVPCETVRETSGLAMSSRNERLTPSQKTEAAAIYRILSEIKKLSLKHDSTSLLIQKAKELFAFEPLQIEYIEIADGVSLKKISSTKDSENPVLFIAAYIGEIRLIDNIGLND